MKPPAVPALLADAMRAQSADVAHREAAVSAAQAALDAARREHDADAAVAEWICCRAAADALPPEDREALLREDFTRRLLARRLIVRSGGIRYGYRLTVGYGYRLTVVGGSVAHLLRGNPPPPSVVMRAAWRVWLALGRRGMASSAYEAWSAGATAEDAARHTAEIEKVLAESATPRPDAAALWRALMGAR